MYKASDHFLQIGLAQISLVLESILDSYVSRWHSNITIYVYDQHICDLMYERDDMNVNIFKWF